MYRALAVSLMTMWTASVACIPQAEASEDEPIVIAHRGASGYRPEHTLMAYNVGIEQGSDYIEPDLVMTKDGHLVARHDVYLSSTTDVASHQEFADRKRTLFGKEDWFVFDFTLAELKTLKAKQPWPSRGAVFDGIETISTIDEIIDFVAAERGDRNVGLYIEMKHPGEFKGMGLDPTEALLKAFAKIESLGIPIYFQCFDGDYLKDLAPRTSVPLIWLIEGAENPATGRYELDVPLDRYAGDIAGVGLYKVLVLDSNGRDSGVVAAAHDLGLKVHLWTIRNDRVGAGYDNVRSELKALWSLDIDGVFADFPDTAVQSRDSFMLLGRQPQID